MEGTDGPSGQLAGLDVFLTLTGHWFDERKPADVEMYEGLTRRAETELPVNAPYVCALAAMFGRYVGKPCGSPTLLHPAGLRGRW